MFTEARRRHKYNSKTPPSADSTPPVAKKHKTSRFFIVRLFKIAQQAPHSHVNGNDDNNNNNNNDNNENNNNVGIKEAPSNVIKRPRAHKNAVKKSKVMSVMRKDMINKEESHDIAAKRKTRQAQAADANATANANANANAVVHKSPEKSLVYPMSLETLCIFNGALRSAATLIRRIQSRGTQLSTRSEVEKHAIMSLRVAINIYNNMVPETTESTEKIQVSPLDPDDIACISLKELKDDINPDDARDTAEFESISQFISTYVARINAMIIPVPFACTIRFT